MKIAADWLDDPAARAVSELLEAGGHQALFVGGCVRNTVLGAPVADLDLSTDARPPRVVELAGARSLRVVPTGIEHGTVTVVSEGTPIEVTTFRRDVETDGRRAVVAFADTVREDALRRDFTMNAIYCTGSGEVVDPLGGLPDLVARRLRFVGTARDRVREDYLRILRFFRFHAWYADPSQGFDAAALDACARHAEGLSQISAERIGVEITKLLGAPDPAMAVAAMERTGVLSRVIPGADITALGPLIHLETKPDPVTRLAALTAEDLGTRLRLSKPDARRHQALAQAARNDSRPAELGYRLGAKDGARAATLRSALLGQPLAPEALSEVTRGAGAQFPVTAADLIPTFQGPALGSRLKALEAAWIAGGLIATKTALLALKDPEDGL